MKVKSKIKLNMGAIKRLNRASVVALEETADAIRTDLVLSQTMPFDKGTLQNTNTFIDRTNSGQGKVSLVFQTPYARRLYYHPEYNFSTHENPNAGGRWAEPYLKGGNKQDFAQKAFAKLYKKNGGL